MSSLRLGKHRSKKLLEVHTERVDYDVRYEEFTDRKSAYDREQELLDLFFKDPNCCNTSDDARSWIYSTTRTDASAAEWREKGVAANKARVYPLGFRHSSESKEKMRVAQLNRDPARYAHLRGRTVSEETREKMRIANSRPRAKGRTFSETHLANMRAASKKRSEKYKKAVIIDGIEYSSSGEAAECLGVCRRTVINRCIDIRWSSWNYLSHGSEYAPITL